MLKTLFLALGEPADILNNAEPEMGFKQLSAVLKKLNIEPEFTIMRLTK